MRAKNPFPATALAVLAALVMALSGCGSEDEAISAAASTPDAVDEGSEATVEDDEDHSDEDHDDEDHDDEDHDDEDHGDEDHDDDHDDDDHGDEDHAESTSGLGAHEHGVADMTVAWSDGEMVIDLISPTQNIFGFEYEATTDEEIALVADRIDALSKPGILAINPEAGCELSGEVATELEFEGSHAELTASWQLSCEEPDQIKRLDAAALFAEFPGFEDIDAQWASDTGQSASELSPAAPILTLE